MSNFEDITGNKYNCLTVVKREANARGGISRWLCKCDCGKYKIVRGSNLKTGAVKSCGCLRRRQQDTHHKSNTRLYRIWVSIQTRCDNKSVKSYKNYGARGIKMCDEWANSFEEFYKWAITNGYKRNLTIERFDNDKGYCPENCGWIPKGEQAKNRTSVLKLKHNEEIHSLADWCKILNLDYKLVHNRIHKLKWDFEKAISVPCDIKKRNRKDAKNG